MWLRIAFVGALSLALSGISILCCYVFGTHLAPGPEGQLYGVLGGVADALKAFLPLAIAGAIAARQKVRAVAGAAMFAVFSFYSFTSELGLYALGRNAVTSDAQAGREAYDAAKADRGRIEARLKELGPQRPAGTVQADMDAAKQGGLWRGSEGCTQATGTAAHTFCASFEKLKGELASAQEAERLRGQDERLAVKLSGFDLAAVMRSSDPQSEALARFTGFSPSAIRDALAILVAALIELGSGLGLWVATAGAARPTQEAPQAPVMAVAEPGLVPVLIEAAPKIEEVAPTPEPVFEEAPTTTIEPEPEEEATPRTFPPRRPRLIASEAAPFGSVAEILSEALETAARGKLELAPVFQAYSDACRTQGKRPVSQDRFVDDLTAFCRDAAIAMTGDEAGIYLRKVRLKKSAKNAEGRQ